MRDHTHRLLRMEPGACGRLEPEGGGSTLLVRLGKDPSVSSAIPV